jgi:Transposase IS66 family
MEVKLAVVSQQGKVAAALRYALSRWAGLSRFLDDGHIEIDSNIVERAIRPLALNRKECVVRGLGRRWRALGDPRLAHRDLQTQWRRSASLSRRHLRPPRRRSPDQSPRRTASVELGRGFPCPCRPSCPQSASHYGAARSRDLAPASCWPVASQAVE